MTSSTYPWGSKPIYPEDEQRKEAAETSQSAPQAEPEDEVTDDDIAIVRRRHCSNILPALWGSRG